MKRNIVFAPPAWEDFQFFRGNGRKTCKRIMDMAREIQCTRLTGRASPNPCGKNSPASGPGALIQRIALFAASWKQIWNCSKCAVITASNPPLFSWPVKTPRRVLRVRGFSVSRGIFRSSTGWMETKKKRHPDAERMYEKFNDRRKRLFYFFKQARLVFSRFLVMEDRPFNRASVLMSDGGAP